MPPNDIVQSVSVRAEILAERNIQQATGTGGETVGVITSKNGNGKQTFVERSVWLVVVDPDCSVQTLRDAAKIYLPKPGSRNGFRDFRSLTDFTGPFPSPVPLEEFGGTELLIGAED